MSAISAFLSLEVGKPLAIYYADSSGCDTIPLDDFLNESKIDMSPAQAARYADALQFFVDELREFVNDSSSSGTLQAYNVSDCEIYAAHSTEKAMKLALEDGLRVKSPYPKLAPNDLLEIEMPEFDEDGMLTGKSISYADCLKTAKPGYFTGAFRVTDGEIVG